MSRPPPTARTAAKPTVDAALTAVDQRGKLAIGALGVTAGLEALKAVTALRFVGSSWSECAAPERFVRDMLTEGNSILVLVCGVFFLLWTFAAFKAADALEARIGRFMAHQTLFGFIIPVVNWFLPYLAYRDLDAAIDPAHLPEPPAGPRTDDAAVGYRDAATSSTKAPEVKRPPLTIWWALWLGASIVGSIEAFFLGGAWDGPGLVVHVASVASAVGAAIAAMVVVRRFGERLRERARRLAALR